MYNGSSVICVYNINYTKIFLYVKNYYVLGNEFNMIFNNYIEKLDNNFFVICNRNDYK